MEIKRNAHTFAYSFLLKGILAESPGTDSEDQVFTLMESMADTSKNAGNNGSIEDLIVGDEEGESSVASVEDQLRKEMTVYEVRECVSFSLPKPCQLWKALDNSGRVSNLKYVNG